MPEDWLQKKIGMENPRNNLCFSFVHFIVENHPSIHPPETAHKKDINYLHFIVFCCVGSSFHLSSRLFAFTLAVRRALKGRQGWAALHIRCDPPSSPSKPVGPTWIITHNPAGYRIPIAVLWYHLTRIFIIFLPPESCNFLCTDKTLTHRNFRHSNVPRERMLVKGGRQEFWSR